MVQTLLSLPELPTPDHAADALAVAICHANGGAAAGRDGTGDRMIALVSGEVAVRRGDHVVVSCAGVGYRLARVRGDAQPRARDRRAGDAFTHLIVREDALT